MQLYSKKCINDITKWIFIFELRALSNCSHIESYPTEYESSPIQLERTLIEYEISPIEFKSSLINEELSN